MRDIKSIGSDGRAVLEDGVEVQLAVDNHGVLHARGVTLKDHVDKIDQAPGEPVRMLSPEQLTSGLDQA